jgi:hypothetical protein
MGEEDEGAVGEGAGLSEVGVALEALRLTTPSFLISLAYKVGRGGAGGGGLC